MSKCNIVRISKRRDGGYRYWCLEHKSDATAKYGKRKKKCIAANDPIPSGEIFEINIRDYPGGIAIWGAVPPVYDTTTLGIDRGIHVHARKRKNGKKIIDKTYSKVLLHSKKDLLEEKEIEVSELDAIYYMVSSVFKYKMRFIECNYCAYPHLDKDWFSVHPHKRHLCHGCGKYFNGNEVGIGNPASTLSDMFIKEFKHREIASPNSINICQKDYPGGIRIWGSNPAILWTSDKPEHTGIHLHALNKNKTCEIDDTYKSVIVDGIKIDPLMIRIAMAQSAMPHISHRILSIRCTNCGTAHLDTGNDAFTPHEMHKCKACGTEFKHKNRLRKIIGNPIYNIKEELAKHAVQPPKTHDLGLRPESI